jgi:uncharacterized protein
MNKGQVVKNTAAFVRKRLEGEGTGHDWWHAYRVWKTSLAIAKSEGKADLFVVQLGALLHDIADWKFTGGDESVGPRIASTFLKKQKVDDKTISQVVYIIENISFKGAGVKSKMKSKEGMIVQDADRLDALGAIGIARTLAYSGSRQREIYNPSKRPEMHKTFAQYKKSKSTAINHFYEKLLLLKEMMNTKTGRKMANERDAYMREYLDRFYKEWDGKR